MWRPGASAAQLREDLRSERASLAELQRVARGPPPPSPSRAAPHARMQGCRVRPPPPRHSTLPRASLLFLSQRALFAGFFVLFGLILFSLPGQAAERERLIGSERAAMLEHAARISASWHQVRGGDAGVGVLGFPARGAQ